MSGPKSVVIVTREDRIRQCHQSLVKLDRQLAHWKRMVLKYELAKEGDIKEMHRKIQVVHALLNEDKFDELQDRASVYTDYLVKEMKAYGDEVRDQANTTRTRRRHCIEAARGLMQRIKSSDISLPEYLQNNLELIAQGQADDSTKAEQELHNILSYLTEEKLRETLSDEQQSLAASLLVDEKVISYRQWRDSRESEYEVSLLKIDMFLAELETEWGKEIIVPYIERLQVLRTQNDSGRQSVLLDSFLIDLSNDVSKLREYKKQLEALEELAALIKTLDQELATQLENQLKHLTVTSNSDMITKMHAQYEKKWMALKVEVQNNSRRKVVLDGLKSLGYNVNEGMETALVENGKMVVRKGATDNYGVELIGLKEKGRFQVRAVAFEGAEQQRTADQDIAAEQSWCDDFHTLQDEIAEAGGEHKIQKSWRVGEMPLRVVARKTEERERRNKGKVLRSKETK